MDLGWVFGRVWEALTAQRLDLWGHFWGTFTISIKFRILCHLGGGWGGFGEAFGRVLGGFGEGLGASWGLLQALKVVFIMFCWYW